MDLNELHPHLSRKYLNSLDSGVEQIDHPLCRETWFVVPPPPPQVLPANLPAQAVAEAEQIIAKQPHLDEAHELDRLVSYLFLRKEAVESSRMEGTLSTIDHLLTPGELFDGWKAKSEGASVRGYAHALETELVNLNLQGERLFTIELVCRLHHAIMSVDPQFRGIPGRPREPGKPGDVVWIRGRTSRIEDSIYNPVPARHVQRCLRQTMDWFADKSLIEASAAGMGLPLTVRIAVGHAHFEAIHPFSDGNGRVGRMLATLQMANQGKLPIYLSGYIEEHKPLYGQVLQEAQKKLNYGPIVEFFAQAIVASHHEARLTRASIESMTSTWRTRGGFRKNSTAERALDWLRAHPIFTVGQLQSHFEVSAQAAHAAAASLRKAGIVRERTGFDRNRVFAAEEVISLLGRPFGADPQESLASAQMILRDG